jgi:hypothetical protein
VYVKTLGLLPSVNRVADAVASDARDLDAVRLRPRWLGSPPYCNASARHGANRETTASAIPCPAGLSLLADVRATPGFRSGGSHRPRSPRAQPARKPEAVAASLECYHNPVDCAPRFGRFDLPSAQQRQQRLRIGAQFLQWLPLELFPVANAYRRPAKIGAEIRGLAIRKQIAQGIEFLRHGSVD